MAVPALGAHGSEKQPEMGAITLVAILALATAGLVVFDVVALRFGADSRDPAGDDRRWRMR